MEGEKEVSVDGGGDEKEDGDGVLLVPFIFALCADTELAVILSPQRLQSTPRCDFL